MVVLNLPLNTEPKAVVLIYSIIEVTDDRDDGAGTSGQYLSQFRQICVKLLFV